MVQVCPPSLHISIGIFRLFTLLEDTCHGLDVSITWHLTPGSAGASFVQYADALQQQSTLRDDIDTVKGQIACLEQIFTLWWLPPDAPQTNTFLQQIADEKHKEAEEKVLHVPCPQALHFSLNH